MLRYACVCAAVMKSISCSVWEIFNYSLWLMPSAPLLSEIIIHMWDMEDEKEALCFTEVIKFMEMTHRRSHRALPQLCFFTWGSSMTLWQEVNLWSSQINCLSQGWIASARLGSFFSPSKAEAAIQNHSRCYRCLARGLDHLSSCQIMAEAFLTLDTATELLSTCFMWCDADPCGRRKGAFMWS